MRGLLIVLGLAACKYAAPTDNAPDDGKLVDTTVVDPDAPDGGPPIAWLHPYAHRKRITLLESKIDDTGGALASFPVLISLTDADLGTATQQPDMAFTIDDAITLLDSEIELFAGNRLVAWVRIPELSATANTALYLYYGNPSPPATNPDGVWTGQFLAAWHLSQDPGPDTAGEIRDASSANRDGTANGMDTTDLDPAQIGNGFTFDNTNNFVDFGSVDLGNTFTISAWANLDPGATSVKTIFSNSAQGSNTNGVRFFLNTNGQQNRRVVLETGDGSNSSACDTADNAIVAGTWAHVAAFVDRGNGSCKIFVNGADATVNGNVQTDFTNSSDFEIGRMEGSLPFHGMLDEIHIASVLRPPGWILTSFTNQVAPGDFYTVGDEEDRPPE